MKKKIRFYPETITGAVNRFITIIIFSLAVYLSIEIGIFSSLKGWIDSNEKITGIEYNTNSYLRNITEIEIYILRYLHEVPVLSLGFVEEYHPYKSIVKNLVDRNQSILLNLKDYESSEEMKEFSRIQYLHKRIIDNIDALMFIPPRDRKINTIVEDIQEDFFIIKSILGREQRELLNSRKENIGLLKRFLVFNMLFIIIIVMIIGFLAYVSFAFRKAINRKLGYLKEDIIVNEVHQMVRQINYPENDEVKPVINLLNRAFDNINSTQKELNNTRDYLRNIIESSPVMLVSVNKDGCITNWNQAAVSYTGINTDEAIGKKFWVLHPFLSKYRSYYWQVISSCEKIHLEKQIFDGKEKSFSNVTIFPLMANGTQGAVIMAEDITEMLKKDEQLRQAQKMEVIGTLSGGIAHDFNNILGAISGSVSLLEMNLQKKGNTLNKTEEYLSIIKKSICRAENIVDQLLTISRKKESSFSVINLNDLISEIEKICSNSFDKRVDLAFEQYHQKAMINADKTQIEQVLLNLCVNASHSMTIMKKDDEKKGGTIKLFVKKVLAHELIMRHPVKQMRGEFWCISISDQGVGMTVDMIDKIFDPFFSTKEEGGGTGLGLAMAYNIVENHNGFIEVNSETGKGSVFRVYLPVWSGEDEEREEDEITHGKWKKSKGMILVIDDEEYIRIVANEILSESGFRVLVATNGDKGLELFKKHHSELDLVMLDLAMPGLSGDEVFIAAKKIDSKVPVLLASGFRGDERIKKILDMGAKGFIKKPFNFNELTQAVFSILENEEQKK